MTDPADPSASAPVERVGSEADSPLTLDVSVGRSSFSASGLSTHVLEAFSDFQNLIRTPMPPDLVRQGDEPEPAWKEDQRDDARSTTNQLSDAPDPGMRVPLRVFLDAKELPRGNAAVALGIAVWAKRYDNASAIDADTAKVYWRDSGRKIPANIGRDLGTAASEGWLERLATRGQFSVTSYGEKHFDEWAGAKS